MSTPSPSTFVALGFALSGCALPSAELQSPAGAEAASADPSQARGTKTKAGAKTNTKVKHKPGRRPRVVEARLISPDHLRLRFSEEMAPVDGIDPNDFRLSVGMAYSTLRYAYAYYYDLPAYADAEGLLQLEAMEHEGEQLDFHLSIPFDLSICREMQDTVGGGKAPPGIQFRGGIYLHYAPGRVPIRDSTGDALEPIGPDWVLRARSGGDQAYEGYIEGPAARRALHDLISVECGPDIPEGSP